MRSEASQRPARYLTMDPDSQLGEIALRTRRILGASNGYAFLSYPRAAENYAIALSRELRRLGCGVWIDLESLDKAGDIEAQVELAIRHASAFILLQGESAAMSKWVSFEVGVARATLDPRTIIVRDLVKTQLFPRQATSTAF